MVVGLVTTPALAQLGLPPLGGRLPVDLERVTGPVRDVVGNATELARVRLDRLDGFVRANRDRVEVDLGGQPARRGELLIVEPKLADITTAINSGFTVLEQGTIEETGITFTRLAIPEDRSLARAEKALRKLLPAAEITADVLHFASGATETGGSFAQRTPLPVGGTVGIIDGGVDSALAAPVTRGFADGAPFASAHGTAVAWLALSAGAERVLVADVYGRDPVGGNALSIARALGWMIAERVPVVSISLVGPPNPLLARTIAAARARGTIVVAAVGNDGPSAPPAYPASYPGVIAVTAVDARNRALIEAGRPLHLDYAAPGADLVAMGLKGSMGSVRGTSYAVPLVAARIAANARGGRGANLTAVDAEAIDLGARGADTVFGRGLLCAVCRPRR